MAKEVPLRFEKGVFLRLSKIIIEIEKKRVIRRFTEIQSMSVSALLLKRIREKVIQGLLAAHSRY